MKLDIGCGDHPRAGYTGVDCRALPGVEIVCPAWDILSHVAEGSVEAIYSRHMLEHLTYRDGQRTMRAWRRALQPGGEAEIIVPDLDYHLRQLVGAPPEGPCPANSRWTNRQHGLAGLYGWQRHAHDVHQSGYTEYLLRNNLQAAGFAAVSRLPAQPWHLHVIARAGE